MVTRFAQIIQGPLAFESSGKSFLASPTTPTAATTTRPTTAATSS